MAKVARTRLIEERKRRQWSQQDLADHLGTTRNNVGRWELGQTTPGPYFRTKMCELFGKHPQELGLLDDQGNMPHEHDHALLSTSRLPTLLWHVPYPRNPFFTGREMFLRTLHEQLHREGRLALSQSWAISGLGGIGKTQIALEYAYQYRQNYHAVFWTSAASRESLLAGFVSIADVLLLPERNEQDQNKIFDAVKHWLATHQGWLLILDNADDFTVVQDMTLPEFSGHLLLTTRAKALGSLAQRLEVETMGMAEGTLFLLRRAKLLAPDAFLDRVPEKQLAAAEAIVIEMDFLPLALDQAGAYIEEVGCSLDSYLELYRTYRADLLRRRGHVTSDHPEPVATTWSLNFQQVEYANPAAADLLRLCAFLEPDAIPEELFREGRTFLTAVLQQAMTSELLLNDAIEALRKFSLVQRNPETGTLRLHRLVQAVLKDTMEKDEQQQWATRAVGATNMTFPKSVEVPAWSRCQRSLPQVQTCSELIQEYALVSVDSTSLLSRAADYLQAVALYPQAESLYHQVIRLCEQVLGAEHPEVAHVLNQLAILSSKQGKKKQAERLFQQVLHIREQTLGPEHPHVASSLNNLANIYSEQGRYAEAEPLYQRALHIREQTLGPEHPHVASSLNNLAVTSFYQGRYTEAEPLYQRALHIREQALGPDHPNVAQSLENLASFYQMQGRYVEAEPLCQRALRIREQALGADHPDLAPPLNTLADLYRMQGKGVEAEPLYQRALRIREQTLGVDHPRIAYSLHGLANLFLQQEKCAEAEPLYQRALRIREQTLGADHPETAEILHDFAALRKAQGRYQEAVSMYQRALTIRDRVLGLQHKKTQETRAASISLLQLIARDQLGDEHDLFATGSEGNSAGNSAEVPGE